jgi:hypothetical protein
MLTIRMTITVDDTAPKAAMLGVNDQRRLGGHGVVCCS